MLLSFLRPHLLLVCSRPLFMLEFNFISRLVFARVETQVQLLLLRLFFLFHCYFLCGSNVTSFPVKSKSVVVCIFRILLSFAPRVFFLHSIPASKFVLLQQLRPFAKSPNWKD